MTSSGFSCCNQWAASGIDVLLELREELLEPVGGAAREEPVVVGGDQQRRLVDHVVGALGLFEVLAQRAVPVEAAGEAGAAVDVDVEGELLAR